MSDQAKPQAHVVVRGDRINVRCTEQATRFPRVSGETLQLRDQISQAVFAHERQCGKCDTEAAYRRGSPDFHKKPEEG